KKTERQIAKLRLIPDPFDGFAEAFRDRQQIAAELIVIALGALYEVQKQSCKAVVIERLSYSAMTWVGAARATRMNKHDQSFRVLRHAQYRGQIERRQNNLASRDRLLRRHTTQAFSKMKAHYACLQVQRIGQDYDRI